MNRSLVVDASFIFRLLLPGSHQANFRRLVTQWQQDGFVLIAPSLWLYEFTSALSKLVHFGELTESEAQRMLALAQQLGVQTIPPDQTQTQLAFDWTIRLNRAAAYDSFYLALAETLDCDFWTSDKRLHNAVSLRWVHFQPTNSH